MAAPNLGIQAKPAAGQERRGPVVGRPGLKHWAGYIQEEFLTELRGQRGYKAFDEMRLNEPAVSALLTAIESIICSVAWEVLPEDDTSGADLAAAGFVERAWRHMDRTRDEILSDVCTMFPFGWALIEVTYKFQEGKVWWGSMDLRGQDSLQQWEFDGDKPVAMVQMPPPTYETIRVPLEKCLLFRTRAEKDNPEGRSILRAAYKPWYYKKVLEEIEAIGAERDLVGVPVLKMPFGATQDEYNEGQQLVERLKNDEQAGVVLPAIGPEPHQQYDLRLLTGQGSSTKVPYTNQLIQRYAAEIGLSMLASFVNLGGSASKSQQTYELKDTRDLFQIAVKNWLGKIADVFNRVAIPRLLAMNGMSGRCTMQHGRITQMDLQVITNFVTAGVQNKLLTPDRALEQFLRREAELPGLAASADAASEAPAPEPPAGQPGASGLTANPGENQNGIFAPNAAAKGPVGGGISPGNPANPVEVPNPPKQTVERDDDVWGAFERRLMSELAGFWDD